MKQNNVIRMTRLTAGLALERISAPMSKTKAWLSAVELGKIKITPETEQVILGVIRAEAEKSQLPDRPKKF